MHIDKTKFINYYGKYYLATYAKPKECYHCSREYNQMYRWCKGYEADIICEHCLISLQSKYIFNVLRHDEPV